MERDTPYRSTLLVVCIKLHAAGGEWKYTPLIHIVECGKERIHPQDHTAGSIERWIHVYTLRVHTAGGGNRYMFFLYNCTSILLVVETDIVSLLHSSFLSKEAASATRR